MAATQREEQVSLKLMVNKETNKVIFAEAEKDFVDILCSFLTLPLGTIARLVQKELNLESVTVGCLNSLYQSVTVLDKGCFWNETSKEMLLQPKNSSEDYCRTLKLNVDDTEPTKYFICSMVDVTAKSHFSTSTNKNCPRCRSPMSSSAFLKNFSKGFVNGAATFRISDELNVIPNCMDNISLGVLQNFGIKGTSSVKEMTVNVTREKVLDLLKCALFSKSTLTDMFLGKKPSLEKSRLFSCEVENENTSTIKIKVKLFMRKTDGKILFALGEENFADLILSFLTFPLGGVVSKLGGKCSFGCIDGLCKSIADIDEKRYFLSKEAKNRLLDPPLSTHFKFSKQILPFQHPCLPLYCHIQRENYKDSVIHNEFFINHEVGTNKNKYIELVNHELSSREVYVKGPRTYVVTDDLVITTASPISTLDLINHLGTPLKDLQEKVVTIGYKECMSILKASLTSTSALTNGLSHLFAEVKEK